MSLGWIVSGVIDSHHAFTSLHQCSLDDPLDALVRRFWKQEEIPRNETALIADEQECEDLFVESHSRTPESRYVVRLPVSLQLPDLASTRGAPRSITWSDGSTGTPT